jgi:GNAT superfamily N-acetyltransferase
MGDDRHRSAEITVIPIADRPDLVPVIARWLWEAFSQDDGHSLDQTQALVATSVSEVGPPQCFVLLVNGEPVGTASLTAEDLDERPDLTPWMASVFVVPEKRRMGLARRLIEAVERAGVDAAISTVWLYTHTAERLYAQAGWQAVELVRREGKKPVVLMRKQLVER